METVVAELREELTQLKNKLWKMESELGAGKKSRAFDEYFERSMLISYWKQSEGLNALKEIRLPNAQALKVCRFYYLILVF